MSGSSQLRRELASELRAQPPTVAAPRELAALRTSSEICSTRTSITAARWRIQIGPARRKRTRRLRPAINHDGSAGERAG
jgi:hypothetical protein